jgi:hypothetical protein
MLGDDLALRHKSLYQLSDAYEKNGFSDFTLPTKEYLKKVFTRLYTPEVVFAWVSNLMHDDRYRDFYIDWSKETLQREPGSIFEGESFTPNKFALMSALTNLKVIKFWR